MLGAASPAHAADAASPARTLLIISKTDHVLEIRDPNTYALRARVPVGPDPHEIETSPDGRRAYISNPGYGSFHEIDVVDLVAAKANKPVDTLPLSGPHGLAYVGGKLWFTAQGSKSVGRYDPATGAVEWAMGTGQDTTHMIHVAPDGKKLFTTNVGSGTVSIMDNELVPPTMPPTGVLPAGAKPRMDWVQTVVDVGKGAEGFDVAPDERELWTVTPAGLISIIDTHSEKRVATIASGMDGAHRIKFTPDGKHVIVVSVKTGQLTVYDAASRKPVKSYKTGRGAGIYVEPDAKRAFISCTPDNFVAVIDLATFDEIARLPVGRPDGITMAVRR